MSRKEPSPIYLAFLSVVQERWPEFMSYSSISEHGDLVVEYPSPYTMNASVLWISADVHYDEIIVSFGGGHMHGGAWDDISAPDYQFQSTIKLIDAILNDEVVGCTLKSGGALGYLEYLKKQPYWCNVRSIRSWCGTHDVDLS